MTEFEKELHGIFPPLEPESGEGGGEGRGEGGGEGGGEEESELTPADRESAAKPMLGRISSCFDSYMSIYVSLEDKQLEEVTAKLVGEESWEASPSGRADSRVFTSSKELFIALKRSFKRGTALNMPATLLELLKVWSKQLRLYSKRLQEQLPPIAQPVDPSQPPVCSLELSAQQKVCSVVNTCEYCSETCAQLEESLAKAMGDEWGAKVDLGPVKEDFQGGVTAGMRALVVALETRCAPALTAMTKVNWATLEELGDEASPYMLEAVSRSREMMPQLGESLMPLYVRFFCDKFVAAFVPRLIGTIYRCKRIGDVGAQQMQLDIGTLKQTLLELPALGQASAMASYTKLVAAQVGSAEQVLKLVQTPEDLIEETVEELQGSGISIDLQKILELKGLKKADSERLLEAYRAGLGAADTKIKELFNFKKG